MCLNVELSSPGWLMVEICRSDSSWSPTSPRTSPVEVVTTLVGCLTQTVPVSGEPGLKSIHGHVPCSAQGTGCEFFP